MCAVVNCCVCACVSHSGWRTVVFTADRLENWFSRNADTETNTFFFLFQWLHNSLSLLDSLCVICAWTEAAGLQAVEAYYGVQLVVNNEARAQREHAVPLNWARGDGNAAKQRKHLCLLGWLLCDVTECCRGCTVPKGGAGWGVSRDPQLYGKEFILTLFNLLEST